MNESNYIMHYLVLLLCVSAGHALHKLVHPANGTNHWPGKQHIQWMPQLYSPVISSIPLAPYPSTPIRYHPFKNLFRLCYTEAILEAFFTRLDQSGGLNLTAVNKEYENPEIGVRMLIRNSTVAACNLKADRLSKRARIYTNLVETALYGATFPDMDVILSLSDHSPGSPGVFKSTGKAGQDLLFIPRSLTGLGQRLSQDIAQWKTQPNCKSRKPQAVFRGSTTGSKINFLEVMAKNPKTPRFKVVELSNKRPDLLDAGFTKVVQAGGFEGAVTNILKSRNLMKGYLSDDEQRCYAAIVVIDGNGVPDRLPRQLGYGIPVVFVHQGLDEFWYSELRPGEDILLATPENLIDTLETLFANPARASQIGQNGRKYVETYLTPGRLTCYMQQALSQYGKRWQDAHRL